MEVGQRDPRAEIEAVYRRRYGKLLRVAVAILRDEQLAEEAVHDAFVRALAISAASTSAARSRSVGAGVWRVRRSAQRPCDQRGVAAERFIDEVEGELTTHINT